jgi:putative ABC transport system permease protein
VFGSVFAGVLAALAAGQLIRSFLFGTETGDPAAISTVVVLLLLVAAMACWVPARRASRVDPLVALREE